jgi:hypothetical protein
MKIFLAVSLVIQVTAFLNIKFGPPFRISDRETTQTINAENVLKNINGFYGLIGPNVDAKKVTTLADLFMGDGHIQGVFFDRGNITFVNKFIRTNKLEYEQRNGKVPEGIFLKLIFLLFNKLRILPSLMDVANTALININQNIYALYERDKPYLLNIDFENKTVNTINKVLLPHLQSFSAHSKYSKELGLETIDYHVLTKTVHYHRLNENFEPVNSIHIKTQYLPIVHDFFVNENLCIFVDSPIVLDFAQLLNGGLPVRFDRTLPSFIHVINKQTGVVQTYKCPSSFYLFHFAKVIENKDTIEIYAPLYDDVDFSQLNIQGKYRKIVLEKATNLVRVEKNRGLEGLDLDFPVAFEDKIVLRYIENKIIKGFVICKNMKQIRSITLRNRFVCGEPVIVSSDGTPYLICFANSMTQAESFLIVIELNTCKPLEFSLGNRSLNLGFHSIFLHHNKNRVLNNPGKESGALLENGHF